MLQHKFTGNGNHEETFNDHIVDALNDAFGIIPK